MDSPTTEQPRGSGGPPPRPDGPRRLRRLPDRGPIAGVCAGVAEYFNVDPIIVRIAAVVLLVTGPGAIAYILAWIFVPAARGGPADGTGSSYGAGDRGMQVLGIVLLVIALSVLWGDWWGPGRRLFFPLALIALGVWLLLRRDDRGTTPTATPGDVPGPPPSAPAAPATGPWPAGPATAWSAPRDANDETSTARDAGTDDAAASEPAEVPAAWVPGDETAGGESGAGTSPGDEQPEADEPADAASAAWTPAGATTATWHAGDETAAGWAAGDATTEADLPPSGTGGAGDGGGAEPPTATYPWGGPPPARPEGPRRGRRLLPPIVLGALLIWAGVAWLIGATLVTSLAVALCIVGIGVVIGAFIGGSWALVPAAVLIGAALVVTSVVDIPLSGPIGDRTWRPLTASEVDDDYEMSFGEGTLDLTGLDLSAGEDLEIQGSVGVGHLVVEVPDTLSLDVAAQAGMGEILLLDVRNNGVGVEDRRTYDAGERSPTVHLDLEVGIGQIEVIQVPARSVDRGSAG